MPHLLLPSICTCPCALPNPLCALLNPSPGSYFFDTANVKNGGNRWATVLMYLSDVEEGGETGAACRERWLLLGSCMLCGPSAQLHHGMPQAGMPYNTPDQKHS